MNIFRGRFFHRLAHAAMAILFILPVSLSAEIYRGIGPFDKLRNLKTRFPGATFEKLNPAWAKPKDVMYQITGSGISGTIVVKFIDVNPFYKRKQLEAFADSGAVVTDSAAQDSSTAEYWNALAESPDDALMVGWVRWVPDSPVPVQRFIAKYGKPEQSGFSDENMEPYKRWLSRGICVYLADDAKSVTRVDYTFTMKDRRDAWKTKYGFVPPPAESKEEKPGKK